jgi:hypothetical protein
MTASDEFLLNHAAAVNKAIHAIANAVGVAVDGLPEPSKSYVSTASMADLAHLRDMVQEVVTELGTRLNDIAVALADVASRPPVVVEVPSPIVNANIVMPEQPAAITFNRDGAGRIIGAEKTPA